MSDGEAWTKELVGKSGRQEQTGYVYYVFRGGTAEYEVITQKMVGRLRCG